ncbi:hypothetical protein, partial [Neisseria meningitidis]|uniref:hypothetical protein n=1 Tax=Neisseria meningitidis TaxID=487 RepID=UPI001EDE1E3D
FKHKISFLKITVFGGKPHSLKMEHRSRVLHNLPIHRQNEITELSAIRLLKQPEATHLRDIS